MKNFELKHAALAFMLFALATSDVKAQSYDFASVGTQWYYEYQSYFTQGYVLVSADFDTIINDVRCTKLTKTLYGYDYYDGLIKRIIGSEYVTQSNDSVLIYRNGSFHLLFDFGASVGDTWRLVGNNIPCDQPYGLAHVVGVGTDTISGNVLRYVKILDDEYSYWGYGDCMVGEPCRDTVKIFERIGPIEEYLLPEQHCYFDFSEAGSLRCFIDDELGYLHFSYTGHNVNCDYINDEYQSIDDIYEDNQMVVYPNPCLNAIHIILNDKNNNDIYLYDNQGALVFQFKSIVGNSLSFDLSDCHKGLYFLKVINDTDIITYKIIKK